MLVRLVFVPPGGGKAEYGLDFELPGVPQPGDYISITRDNQVGTEDFVVRRTRWHLHHPEVPPAMSEEEAEISWGTVRTLSVEREFAINPAFSSEEHVEACEAYRRGRGKLLKFDPQ